MSNFSEFHQGYEYASHILFYLGWIFADFVRVVAYSLLFNNSRLDQSQQSELSTYFVLSTDCKAGVVSRSTRLKTLIFELKCLISKILSRRMAE